jgi:hypothetical protein
MNYFKLLLFCFSITTAFSAEFPQILIANEETISAASPDNLIKDYIEKIQSKFGVKITSEFVSGIIFMPLKDGKPQYMDIEAELDNSLISSSLDCNLNRFDKKEKNYLKEEILRITKHSKEFSAKDKKNIISYAYAIALYRHVFLPENQLQSFIYDLETQTVEENPERTLLHESMHLWENNSPENLKIVSNFLHASGGYYSRIGKAEKDCPQFNNYNSFTGNEKTFCGFNTISELRASMATKYKIPQRYGKNIKKVELVADKESCENWTTQKIIYKEKTYCLSPVSRNYAADEDIHSFRKGQSSEYFAIMTELYFYNPKEFKRVASPEEQKQFEVIVKKLKQ